MLISIFPNACGWALIVGFYDRALDLVWYPSWISIWLPEMLPSWIKPWQFF
ncbi:MAG: hypothetical protein QGF71_08015 [Rhodospirillales bacterium]|jgi:hypothetical protein|nr:hypothetical protein [Rhodospirillales bacterium]|tara:strand:+ start:458 stop:610 length:153 start_codon:yes stop_codon:yes gene_type:complete